MTPSRTCVRRLVLLPLGELETSTEEMLPGRADGTRYRFPVTAALLDLGDRGWMLFDTGMDDAHVDDPGLVWGHTDLATDIAPKLADDQTLRAQLNKHGLSLGHITHVVNSHLHFDHAGNNHLFPEATVHLQAEQLADLSRRPASYPVRFDPTRAHVAIHRGAVEVVPGVTALPTDGHVPGHQSLLVQLDDAPDYILCGDAIPNQDFLDDQNFASFHDPPIALRTAQDLLALGRARRAIVVFSHDQHQLDAILASGAF